MEYVDAVRRFCLIVLSWEFYSVLRMGVAIGSSAPTEQSSPAEQCHQRRVSVLRHGLSVSLVSAGHETGLYRGVGVVRHCSP